MATLTTLKIDLAPNGRFKCNAYGCGKRIEKGSYRIGHCMFHNKRQYWQHIDCYLKHNTLSTASSTHFPYISSQLDGYSHLPKSLRRKIRKSLWPNQVNDKTKPRLNFIYSFKEITKEELELECEKRDLYKTETKIGMENILQKYLTNEKCKKYNKYLIIGYLKKKEKKYKHDIPTFIKTTILKYYPPYLQ